MTIEIKLTCETVAEAQAEMAALLEGRPRITTSGSEPRAVAPVTPTPTAPSTTVQPAVSTPSDTASLPETGAAESISEQPKRGRGRPRKESVTAVAGEPLQADGAVPEVTATISSTLAADEGNAPSGEASATETAEPTSDTVSSTSSETAPQVLATEQATAQADEATIPPAADIQAVTDADLQRFCAKLAEKFGGPQKVFDACKPYLADGDVARPTNIRATADRWAFIRGMEIESGLMFHG